MRFVSYTRTTSCYPGADIPSDVITSQNERIKNYAVKHGWKIENRYSDRKKSKEENTAFEQLLNDGIQRNLMRSLWIRFFGQEKIYGVQEKYCCRHFTMLESDL